MGNSPSGSKMRQMGSRDFFLNNEKHETTRKKFMGSGFDCRNALFIP